MKNLEGIPALPGTYALQLVMNRPISLSIGRLGEFYFSPGEYLYLGSAWGPGGLRARLGHHLRHAGKPHWHIDWLRREAALKTIFYSTQPSRLECLWSQAVLALPGAFTPAAGFGSSDCRSGCPAHLAVFSSDASIHDVEAKLRSVVEGIDLHQVSVIERMIE